MKPTERSTAISFDWLSMLVAMAAYNEKKQRNIMMAMVTMKT